MKEKILSLTSKNFVFDFFKASGPGGQHKNKTQSACRCRHLESGSLAIAVESRSQHTNKKKAFERCTKTESFQKWLKVQIAKANSEYVSIEDQVEKDMAPENIKIEFGKKFE